MKPSRWCALGVAGLIAVTLAGGGAATDPPPGAARADGFVFVAPGSRWVLARRDSGSFGSSDRPITIRALGERTWQGRKVHAYKSGQTAFLVEFPTGKWVARVRGATLVESFDPPVGWGWPIWAGKSWTESFRFTYHQRGQTFDVRARFEVEAYEDIKVPAGTFKVFRVTYSDGGYERVDWWSPELGIDVKTRIQRTERHSAGPGSRERELVSHDIKRQRSR